MAVNLGREDTRSSAHEEHAQRGGHCSLAAQGARAFFGAAAVPNRFNNTRSFVTIPDLPNATKMMKALHPEIVIPGYGAPGAAKIFDDSDQYYELLLEKVTEMVRDGRSLGQIKQELRMPEYDNGMAKNRFPANIEAAYRAVKAGYSPFPK
jgi:hypothetical protein